jgi:proteasome assembly chaperone (PAC2) family protein
MYATGEKAYRMANMVLDVAQKFKASRVYTSGAAVSQIHHSTKPRVWAVPNSEKLEEEIRTYSNTVLMSGGEDRHGQATITGLNGLLLGVAKKRGIDAICLMGEIPYYVQASPFPYPKAAISVLEILSETLGIPVDTVPLVEMARKMEEGIEGFLNNLYQEESMPEEVRNQIKEMIEKTRQEPETPAITDEDQRRIMEQLDEFFDQGEGGNDRTS